MRRKTSGGAAQGGADIYEAERLNGNDERGAGTVVVAVELRR